MPLSSGDKLGPYEVLAPLGAGGMGEVYKGRDTRLDRIVAIKVLPASLAADPERMELIEGESLESRLTKGPLPLDQVLRLGSEIADALSKAHRQGIVHRDLKPA